LRNSGPSSGTVLRSKTYKDYAVFWPQEDTDSSEIDNKKWTQPCLAAADEMTQARLTMPVKLAGIVNSFYDQRAGRLVAK